MSWVSGEYKVNFSIPTDEVMLHMYTDNGEWDLLFATAWRKSLRIGVFHEEALPLTGFRIGIKRNPTYYLYNIIVPVVMLTLLTALVFVLPCEAGEKVC